MTKLVKKISYTLNFLLCRLHGKYTVKLSRKNMKSIINSLSRCDNHQKISHRELDVFLYFRTKQEIEADFNRRKIVKKFRKRIQKFENAEMDAEMDLRKGMYFRLRINTHSKNSQSSNSPKSKNNLLIQHLKKFVQIL